MEISHRLKTIASQVKYKTMADIGTDHAYLPIYLAKKNMIDKAVACDINKGPLLKANQNIKKYDFENIIKTRLGSGFDNISPHEFETAVIAGMGGMLMIDIMKNSIKVVKSFKQLILQPQLDVNAVRRFLHSIGFKIYDEKIIIDENKYYNILLCLPTSDEVYSDMDYQFGKILIENKDAILKEYVLYEKNKIEKIVLKLKEKTNKNQIAIERLHELKGLLNTYCEVLKCL